MINDWTLTVATANGTGSQTANNTLVKTLFRMGIPVGGKNLFPSNIQGLPTWFTIRVHPKGYVGRKSLAHIFVGFNKQTLASDIQQVTPGGAFFYNQEFNVSDIRRDDIQMIAIPAREIASQASSSVKMQKLLSNMAYVGVLCELLNLDKQILEQSLRDQFPNHPEVQDVNLKTLAAAQAFAREHIPPDVFSFRAQTISDNHTDNILIDGNAAAALGLINGGCSFLSWYPITPASSLAENFENYAPRLRDNTNGNAFAVVQAEDELSAINMAIGAGWAGARSVTSTSGPGLSLMSEAAGLCYFAEVPTVIWDVQRAGPSTGLPTRTLQGDLSSAYTLSHGDTEHIVLLPGSPFECYEFGEICLDLAERLQTLVIVLSDLDLGMNFWVTPQFVSSEKKYDRGKVLNAKDLQERGEFARYKDIDGDGIPYRTLPGTHHELAAYFTRGTGHNEKAGYTEDNEVFKKLLDRLKLKMKTAAKIIPAPILKTQKSAKIGLIAYGSTDLIMNEVIDRLNESGIQVNYLRPRALPLHADIETFISEHSKIYVIEQNRDAQFLKILRQYSSNAVSKDLRSVLSYDGLPIAPDHVIDSILSQEALQ
jgi:2-oxoglutarate ferredoxin oxidoreductase subunit alpha